MFVVRILDRYIFREIVTPFFLSMAVLTFVLFIQKMFRIAELVVSKGSTVEAAARLVLYLLPGFLVIAVPMSLLIASIAAFARLSSDAEITAMKASRVGLYTMLRPVAAFAFLAFLATSALSLSLLPAANLALKTHLFNMVKSRSMVGIEPGVFSTTFDGMIIYVDGMSSLDDMEGIFISDERSADAPYTIIAKRGKLIADPRSYSVTLALKGGEVHPPPSDDKTYTRIDFDTGRLNLDISHALLAGGRNVRELNEMSTPELFEELEEARGAGRPTLALESEIHTRFSIPVACLIFGIMGAPLGIRRTRSGKSAGVAIALTVFFIYYILVSVGRNMAETARLPAAVAYWSPNAFMAAAAGALVYMKGREITLGIFDRIAGIIRSLKARINIK